MRNDRRIRSRIRIRVHTSDRIRIQQAQKHLDPVDPDSDPDLQHWFPPLEMIPVSGVQRQQEQERSRKVHVMDEEELRLLASGDQTVTHLPGTSVVDPEAFLNLDSEYCSFFPKV